MVNESKMVASRKTLEQQGLLKRIKKMTKYINHKTVEKWRLLQILEIAVSFIFLFFPIIIYNCFILSLIKEQRSNGH